MIKMIDGLKRYFHTFILSTKGSIAIMFVFMIPVLLVFMAYYFDSVQLAAKEARLEDAVDEGTLAISSRGWGEDKHKENIDILKNYLKNYLPEAVSFTNINVDINSDEAGCLNKYGVSATAEIKMLFHYDEFPSFNKTEFVNAKSKACLRGAKSSFIGDFAFLIDLSSSMRCVMSANSAFNSCLDDQLELKESAKLTKLKEVVTKMIVEIMNSSEQSKFALVPFNIGVPVKLDGKNEKGGELVGCSVAFTPKAEFDIDYAYWSNKYIPPDTNTIIEAVSLVDNARFTYYNNYVIDQPSDLDRYCTQNDPSHVQKNRGQALRSCMSDLNYKYVKTPKEGSQDWYYNNTMLYHNEAFSNIYKECVDPSAVWVTSCVDSMMVPFFSRKLHPTFTTEWKKARDVRQVASKLNPDMSYYEEHKCGGKNRGPFCLNISPEDYQNRQLLYRNIVNDESIDYEKTLVDMFKKSSIRTFAMPWVYRRNYDDVNVSTKTLRPYHWMCPSIAGGDSGKGGIVPETQGMANMKETMPYANINHYLIDLTRFCGTNRFIKGSLGACDSSKVNLKVIEDISVGRGVRTDTITGLLRAVPVVADSKNNFKSIIIVSDGADNVNLTLSDKMLNKYKICDRIRDGFKKLNYEVGLYMIFTYSPDENDKEDDEDIAKHVALWTSCVGKDNFYYANTIDKLQEAIKDILKRTSTHQPSDMAAFVSDD